MFKRKPGVVAITALNGNAEASKLATNLMDIFKDANWTIDEDRVQYVIPMNGYLSGARLNFEGTINADGSNPQYDKNSPGGHGAACFLGKPLQGGVRLTPMPAMKSDHIGI